MNTRYFPIVASLFVLALGFTANAQDWRQPMDHPIILSGNFGELRNNHFHSGIDFKTQGVEGKPIHAVQEGYVSRISVSPWGYGNGLYISHPDGTTSVYAHLQKFAPKIAAYVKEKQYEKESFRVDLTLSPQELPVGRGETVALSGNTGSSGGPHLHFEIRDTETEEPLDPLEVYKPLIKDTKEPKILGVMVYPMEGMGAVNGSARKLKLTPTTAPNGKQTLTGNIEAWGEIGLAVSAYDYMDNTSNIYGVKEVTLSVDSQIVYHSDLTRFAFDETRYINSYVDYEEWKEHHSFFMKSFIDPGCRLRFREGINRGILTINEARTYHLTYCLKDAFGNTSQLSFQIVGKEQPIPEPDTEGTELMHWRSDNRFGAKGIRLTIEKGNLYDDLRFRYSAEEDSSALAAIHHLHNKPLALHRSARLCLRLQTDTLGNKQQYGVVRLLNGRKSWVGGTYHDGWVDADIKEMGSYTLAQDTLPPTITPLNPATWTQKQAITFRLTDNLSGVESYRGEIDGGFALFEMNSKSVVTYRFDKERLAKGKHTLKMVVTDACGNQAEYTCSFTRQ